jgi:GcrA cell cycle regulator
MPKEITRYGDTVYRWLCDCDCGTITYVYTNEIISGTRKSCGCIGMPKSIPSPHRAEIIERFLNRTPGTSIAQIASVIGISKGTAIGVLSRDGYLKTRAKTLPFRKAVPFPLPGTCQYSYGHPNQPDFRWCGQQCQAGSSFCEEHHHLCYIPESAAA